VLPEVLRNGLVQRERYLEGLTGVRLLPDRGGAGDSVGGERADINRRRDREAGRRADRIGEVRHVAVVVLDYGRISRGVRIGGRHELHALDRQVRNVVAGSDGVRKPQRSGRGVGRRGIVGRDRAIIEFEIECQPLLDDDRLGHVQRDRDGLTRIGLARGQHGDAGDRER